MAKSWRILNNLLVIVIKSMKALLNLVIVGVIVMVIFTVIGRKLFAATYRDNVSVFTEEGLQGGDFSKWTSFTCIYQ